MKRIEQNPYYPMPKGYVFGGSGDLNKVWSDLRFLARHIQSLYPIRTPKLRLFHDWWEHDELMIEERDTSIHELFQAIETPRELLENTPDESSVFLGYADTEFPWYLRFRADWNPDDTILVAAYAFAAAPESEESTEKVLKEKLSCLDYKKTSTLFYNEILDGLCTI